MHYFALIAISSAVESKLNDVRIMVLSARISDLQYNKEETCLRNSYGKFDGGAY